MYDAQVFKLLFIFLIIAYNTLQNKKNKTKQNKTKKLKNLGYIWKRLWKLFLKSNFFFKDIFKNCYICNVLFLIIFYIYFIIF